MPEAKFCMFWAEVIGDKFVLLVLVQAKGHRSSKNNKREVEVFLQEFIS